MLSEAAREARRKYQREYYRKNHDRIRRIKEAYWERVAQKEYDQAKEMRNANR